MPAYMAVLACALLLTSLSARADDKTGPNAWNKGRGRNADISMSAVVDKDFRGRRSRKRIDSGTPRAPRLRDSVAVDSTTKVGHRIKVSTNPGFNAY